MFNIKRNFVLRLLFFKVEFYDNLMNNRAIFWFKRDLRVEDNMGLHHAVKESNMIWKSMYSDKEYNHSKKANTTASVNNVS